MVRKQHLSPYRIRRLFPKRRTNNTPDHVSPIDSTRAASVDTAYKKSNPSRPIPESNIQLRTVSTFPFIAPIRKIIEPPIVGKMRRLQTERLKDASPSDAGSQQLYSTNRTASVHHYRPGREFRTQVPLPHAVNPFRGIYYVPIDGPGSERTTTKRNVFRYSNQKTLSETPTVFRRQTVSTIPYRTLALKQQEAQHSLPPAVHQQQQRPNFSTSSLRRNAAPPPAPAALHIDQYHRLADTYIDNLVAKLEEIQEERDEVDCEYSAGVLTLTFPPAGTYVLNKQPPNRQIWLSSPSSGPKRYDFVLADSPKTYEASAGGEGTSRGSAGTEGQGKRGDWVYLRDGSTLSGLLREELGVELDGEVGLL